MTDKLPVLPHVRYSVLTLMDAATDSIVLKESARFLEPPPPRFGWCHSRRMYDGARLSWWGPLTEFSEYGLPTQGAWPGTAFCRGRSYPVWWSLVTIDSYGNDNVWAKVPDEDTQLSIWCVFFDKRKEEP